MKFPKTTAVQKIAPREAGRYAVNRVLLEKTADGGAVLVATDGRRLIVQPVVMDEKDEPGLLSQEALALATKGLPKSRGYAEIEANGSQRVFTKDGVVQMERPKSDEGEFPRWQAVVPTEDKQEGDVEFGLNAEYLAEIQKALGSGAIGLRLRLRKQIREGVTRYDLNPIRIDPIFHGSDGDHYVDGKKLVGYAVLMPINVDTQ